MTMQDFILAACQWGFLVALLPSIFGKSKPAMGTSIMTAALLSIMATTFLTLALWASAISTALVAVGWIVLACQARKMRFKKAYEVFK